MGDVALASLVALHQRMQRVVKLRDYRRVRGLFYRAALDLAKSAEAPPAPSPALAALVEAAEAVLAWSGDFCDLCGQTAYPDGGGHDRTCPAVALRAAISAAKSGR